MHFLALLFKYKQIMVKYYVAALFLFLVQLIFCGQLMAASMAKASSNKGKDAASAAAAKQRIAKADNSFLCKIAPKPSQFQVLGVIPDVDGRVKLIIETGDEYKVVEVNATGVGIPLIYGAVLNAASQVEQVKSLSDVWPTLDAKKNSLAAVYPVLGGTAFVFKRNKTQILSPEGSFKSHSPSFNPDSRLLLSNQGPGVVFGQTNGVWTFQTLTMDSGGGALWAGSPRFHLFETNDPEMRTRRIMVLALQSKIKVDFANMSQPQPITWKWATGYVSTGADGMYHLYTNEGVYLFGPPSAQFGDLSQLSSVMKSANSQQVAEIKSKLLLHIVVVKLNYLEHFACGQHAEDPENWSHNVSSKLYYEQLKALDKPEQIPKRELSLRSRIVAYLVLLNLMAISIACVFTIVTTILICRANSRDKAGIEAANTPTNDSPPGGRTGRRRSSRRSRSQKRIESGKENAKSHPKSSQPSGGGTPTKSSRLDTPGSGTNKV